MSSLSFQNGCAVWFTIAIFILALCGIYTGVVAFFEYSTANQIIIAFSLLIISFILTSIIILYLFKKAIREDAKNSVLCENTENEENEENIECDEHVVDNARRQSSEILKSILGFCGIVLVIWLNFISVYGCGLKKKMEPPPQPEPRKEPQTEEVLEFYYIKRSIRDIEP